MSPARFGQHFLEAPWADKLVRAIAPASDDAFIEIGPGRGVLTSRLAAQSAGVVAIEVDPQMVNALTSRQFPRVTLIHHDVLTVTPARLQQELAGFSGQRVRLAGNLPYNIAAPILFALFDWIDAGLHLENATVMVQREVADRLLASPGTKDYGTLGILVSHRASMTRVLDLPPGAFRPMPKVRSTVVRLEFHPPHPPVHDANAFPVLVRSIFSRRRKTLSNALLAYEPARHLNLANLLQKAGIDGRRRPETLSLAEMVTLSDLIGSTTA